MLQEGEEEDRFLNAHQQQQQQQHITSLLFKSERIFKLITK
jgi:hypothetical protein